MPSDMMVTTQGRYVSPKTSILSFKSTPDGWLEHQAIYEASYMGDQRADSYASLKTRVLPALKPGHFYRIPGWGSPNYQLINVNGKVVAEYRIPNPLSQRMPVDAKGRLKLYREKRNVGNMLVNASVDGTGKIFFLLDGLAREEDGELIDYGGRLILSTQPGTDTYHAFLLQDKIRELQVNDSGTGAYAMDGANDHLVRLQF